MTTIYNAHGGIHCATCSRCGASLTHVFYFDGKPVGEDCFERLMGFPVNRIPPEFRRNNVIDLDAWKAAEAGRQAEMARVEAESAARVAEALEANSWLIDELTPHAQWCGDGFTHPANFAASIICSLRNGEHCTELAPRAKQIIIDVVSKTWGRRGSKSYSAKADEISNRLYESEASNA